MIAKLPGADTRINTDAIAFVDDARDWGSIDDEPATIIELVTGTRIRVEQPLAVVLIEIGW